MILTRSQNKNKAAKILLEEIIVLDIEKKYFYYNG